MLEKIPAIAIGETLSNNQIGYTYFYIYLSLDVRVTDYLIIQGLGTYRLNAYYKKK